jgi:hypothetical protein
MPYLFHNFSFFVNGFLALRSLKGRNERMGGPLGAGCLFLGKNCLRVFPDRLAGAQNLSGGMQVYERNIGWRHRESGGPTVGLTDPAAAPWLQSAAISDFRGAPLSTLAFPARLAA